MSAITAVVLTLNEERQIEYCLRSIRSWCDEIVLVDMHSEDATTSIAAKYGALVVDHERIPDFDLARAAGIAASTCDWIFSIDADEVVTPALATWIREFVDSDPDYDMALIPRANVFLGRWLKSTPWWPGKPRLFRRGAVHASADLHHGLVPEVGVRIAKLPKSRQLSMWHFARSSLDEIGAKTNRYTTIQARQRVAAGDGDPRWHELFLPAGKELLKYVVKRGYRDGLGGLFYAVDRAYYRFSLQAKRWDEARVPARQARYDESREKILSGFPDAGRVDGSPIPTEPRP